VQVSGNPIFDSTLIVGAAWPIVVQPLFENGRRRMVSLLEFEDDDTLGSAAPPPLPNPQATSPIQRVPTHEDREMALDWLLDVLGRAELGDKSGSGPFVADKFPLQSYELAKQLIGTTLFLPISAASCSLRHEFLEAYEPSPTFARLQKYARDRLEFHQRQMEALWRGDTPTSLQSGSKWTKVRACGGVYTVLSDLPTVPT